MIPKIIHYCWFGGNPLPPLALECIASWRKYLPEYEIWQWSEGTPSNFPKGDESLVADKIMTFDVNTIPYTAEAYKQKKYAFVSDYARFWILYMYGGLYFDTDVELIRPIDDIIAKGSFMGIEQEYRKWRPVPKGSHGLKMVINTGLGLGLKKGNDIAKYILDAYSTKEFVLQERMVNQETVVHIVTQCLLDKGMIYKNGIQKVGDITLYPTEYFSPTNITTGRTHITKNTRSIHHYNGTWTKDSDKISLKDKIKNSIPESLVIFVSDIINLIK